MSTQTTIPAPTAAPGRPRALLATVLTGQAMATMDTSIMNVALPSVRADLHATNAQVQFTAAAYLVAFAALVVTGARLGERHGPLRVFRLGVAGFLTTSLVCGLAPDPGLLIAARAGQGAAGALMVPQVLTLIQSRFDREARAKAIGMYSMVLALGVACGQILGGVLVTANLFHLAWRPALLINVPVGLVLLAACARQRHPRPAPAAQRMDLAGAGILAALMGALVVPLVFAAQEGWPVWCFVVLALGGAGLCWFARFEGGLAAVGRQPLLDLRILRYGGVRPGLAACFLVMGCYSAFVFTLTLYLQGGLGFSPLHSGLTLVPYTIGFATVSLTWTRLPQQTRRPLPIAGPILFATAIILLAALSTRHWPTYPAAVLLACAGAGHAASYSPLFARLGALAGAEHGSALSALGNTGTLLAGAIGIAGIGALYLTATTTPGHAHTGLAHVAGALAIVLTITATCAGLAHRHNTEAG